MGQRWVIWQIIYCLLTHKGERCLFPPNFSKCKQHHSVNPELGEDGHSEWRTHEHSRVQLFTRENLQISRGWVSCRERLSNELAHDLFMIFRLPHPCQRNISFLLYQALRKQGLKCTFQDVCPFISKRHLKRCLSEDGVRKFPRISQFNILSAKAHFKGLWNIMFT